MSSMDNSQIAIINSLPEILFSNFCHSFFETISFTKIGSIQIMEDGIITGRGSIELGIVMSYHFVFLAKQQMGIVPDTLIQDLLNNMADETHKGIFVTTGQFSRKTKKASKTKGLPPVDLIDGKGLIERLRKNNLELSIETGKVFFNG